MAPQRLRRQELAAIGAAGEGTQAEIDAEHGGGRRGQWRLRRLFGDIAEDGDGPAVGVLPDRGRDHPTGPARRFGAAYGADDREDDVLVAEPHLSRLEGKLIAVLRFEARPARRPGEGALDG